jgi:N-acetylmuramoyl-L-alanine amidase
MVKICLDAGHYGKYNISPANKAYTEAEVMWKLHLLQKKYLEQYGFEVITTRANQATDMNLTSRGRKAKGCDLFISNHSNAVGGRVDESVDYPVAYVPLNGTGDEIGKLLADCIAKTMGTKQTGRIATKKGVSGDYYGVIRGAVAVGVPGIILEHSFHTNTNMTAWLLKDSNLDKLAKAEAAVIASYFGKKQQTSVTTTPAVKADSGAYRVKVTAFALNVRRGAGVGYNIVSVIKDKGVYTIVEEKNGWGKLKSGAGWINLKYTKRV